MKVIAEIFSQGEEVVSGQTVDSNAAWLSQQLNALGFTVKRHTAVGDNLDDLVRLVQEIASRADCCICTGGLGPTVDDLTAEAVSIASGQALSFDAQAYQQMEAYFARRQKPMPPANRKQAYFPQTAVRIDNPVGTAPGFALHYQRCWFVFLPGVPSEMKQMFPAVRQPLLQRFALQPDCLVTLRSIGLGESAIQQRLQDLQWPDGLQLGFRAAVDEVQTKLHFAAEFPEPEKQAWVHQVAALIGDYVFAIDGLNDTVQGDLLTVIDRAMVAKQLSLASLETASGGLLAGKCFARAWLKAALIGQNIAQSAAQFELSANDDEPATIAQTLAERLQRQQGSDLALVQLYQGDADDYESKDKCIVLYNCLQTPNGALHSQFILAGAASTKQNQAALLSLDLLRRYLQNQCL